MIDSLQVIHDTIYVKGADALDIMSKTHEFYDSAWDKLFNYSVALISIFGVALPILATLYQKRLIRIDREALENKIAEGISANAPLYDDLKTQIKNSDLRMKGFSHMTTAHLTALSKQKDINNMAVAFHHALKAAYYFKNCREFANANTAILTANFFCKNLTKEKIEKIRLFHDISNHSVDELIKALSVSDVDGAISNAVLELNETYRNIPDK